MQQPDDVDIRILQLLQENARLTGDEIGNKIHKSGVAVNRRIRALQDGGYIKKYVAVLDHKKLHLDFIAFTHVKLKDHSNENFELFGRMIAGFPEVLECHQLAGDYDFLLRIAVRDTEAYSDFLTRKLFQMVVAEKVMTGLVLKSQKNGTPLLLSVQK
jgi:Lrp/AsnC family leucine-responsive transcriptional regulator